MPDIRISELPSAPAAIDGSELVPVVQNGLTVKTTVSAITQSPSLTATFLTVNQQPLLPNSRALSAGVGIGIADGGAQSTINLTLNGTSGSLEGASTGVIVKSAANTISARTLTASGNGISVTNGNGVSGNPTFQLTGLAAAIANMSGTGLIGLNSTTLSPLTIIGAPDEISVLDGNGAGGNPTIGISDNAVFPGLAGVTLPNGTTAQRGATQGQIRFNTTSSRFEGNNGSGWQNFGTGDGSIASVAGVTNQIVVTTVAGAATVSIDPDPVIPGTGAIQIPAGATVDRPGGVNGQLRYNSQTANFEGYANGNWGAIVTGSGVTSVGTGTGLTGGPITSTGTISIANTTVAAASYGSATAVPTYTVNAQGQLTAAANVTIAIPSSAITDKGLANGVATLDSGGKVPISELPAAVLGALSYQGTWNASTNTPTLVSSVGVKGYYFVVSVAGTTNLNGVTDWQIGDWCVYNGTEWQKVDNTDAVTSVNGFTGAVVLTTTNVAEGTNEYFTTARARTSVSAGTGISYDSGTGVITNAAPDQTVSISAGTGITTSGTYPSFTVTNAAPDQTVVLTAGTGISTSGTYPSFTITNTSPSLGGDVVGPASATDNAVARYDATTGKLIQNSLVLIGDTGSVTGVNALTAESLVVNNNVTLGSSNTDTVDVNARITTDLEPNANNAKDIGTSGRNWRDAFFGRTLHTVNLELTGTTSYDGAQGTVGQVLTSAGTGNTPTWTTPAGGVTLSNDTATATDLFPTFASATSGSVSTIFTGNARLLYRPSTGELKSTVLVATNGIMVNSATVSENYTISSGSNAMSAGPVTINSGITVTVSSGSVWSIV